jgi:Protein of unknown function (DUF2585)
MPWKHFTPPVWGALAAALLVVQAATLLLMGQPATCVCGTVTLWHGIVQSPENSQQLTDWYSLSHVIHGVLFYGLLRWLAPGISTGVRLVLAFAIEGGWEIFENTPFLIDRYRQSALAQGYSGDSVLNSVADTLSMATGFVLARRLPVVASFALVVGLELFAGVMIRDNLALNIIQLIAPNDALSRWQAGP